MNSNSLKMVLAWLDTAVHRAKDLYRGGREEEAMQRLDILESICLHTLKQIQDMRDLTADAVGATTARQMQDEVARFIEGWEEQDAA